MTSTEINMNMHVSRWYIDLGLVNVYSRMTSRAIRYLYTYFILETSVLISREVALDCILASSIKMAFSRSLPAFVGICFLFLLSKHYLNLSFDSSTHDYNALDCFPPHPLLFFALPCQPYPHPPLYKLISTVTMV